MTSEFSVAVHALVFLNHKGCVYSSEGLAENICTNPARIRKVMAKLKKAELVETKEGIEGGYHFVMDSKDVTLYMIADALDFTFVSSGWKSGSSEMKCLIASGMGGLMEEVYEDLNQRCLARLKEITIADLDKKIFKS
ncbi:Rrf2 family transcriptional regulator [Clostridium sp. AF19-22AC]|jgi:Rrf2 family protein|uniref:Rrf2 family protein n=1 Tax=Faecalicatena orotica TaxID=1544 RepID=A0A2Y9BED3_9FIRM|nr:MULTISPECIES: Rrf2 family transcriptional regulator [Clostridia]PWJ29394.1 Rrf2 family protein [Faecalicatena orotica]RHR24418.1 Rrf2 family transcriptional regulator [Clostridium sp. AF19-22AC]SSA55849.1 Rrf2 family protein [Faecalicatena orotica]